MSPASMLVVGTDRLRQVRGAAALHAVDAARRSAHTRTAIVRARAVDPRAGSARRPRLQLGPVGRRRPARHAQPHHARGGAARRRARSARAASFSLAIPFDADRAAVGQRAHAASHRTRAAHAHGERARSPATRATSRRATTRSAWARRPPRTGTPSRTPATRSRLYNDTPSAVVTADAARRGSGSSTSARSRPAACCSTSRGSTASTTSTTTTPITGDDLERARAAGGVTVEPGDALLVRTGQMHFLRAGDKHALLDAVARALDPVDRVAPRPRRRRGRDRHADVRGLPVRGPRASSCRCT